MPIIVRHDPVQSILQMAENAGRRERRMEDLRLASALDDQSFRQGLARDQFDENVRARQDAGRRIARAEADSEAERAMRREDAMRRDALERDKALEATQRTAMTQAGQDRRKAMDIESRRREAEEKFRRDLEAIDRRAARNLEIQTARLEKSREFQRLDNAEQEAARFKAREDFAQQVMTDPKYDHLSPEARNQIATRVLAGGPVGESNPQRDRQQSLDRVDQSREARAAEAMAMRSSLRGVSSIYRYASAGEREPSFRDFEFSAAMNGLFKGLVSTPDEGFVEALAEGRHPDLLQLPPEEQEAIVATARAALEYRRGGAQAAPPASPGSGSVQGPPAIPVGSGAVQEPAGGQAAGIAMPSGEVVPVDSGGRLRAIELIRKNNLRVSEMSDAEMDQWLGVLDEIESRFGSSGLTDPIVRSMRGRIQARREGSRTPTDGPWNRGPSGLPTRDQIRQMSDDDLLRMREELARLRSGA